MKISNLYIKYFIIVMTIIIAAQISIGFLFRVVGGFNEKKHINPELSSIAFLLSDYCSKNTLNRDNRNLPAFLQKLSNSWTSDIWLEDSKGNTIAASTDSERPDFPVNMVEIEEYGISKEANSHPSEHLIIKPAGSEYIFYIIRKGRPPFANDIYFIIGLGIITVIVALLLFPLSKKITVPLKKLTESANAISRGEFDIRVEETSHDEVGELARAFNVMSGRVLQMINGTKELTANISHHIRSPLSRISVSVEMMRNRINSGKKTEAVNLLSSVEQEIDEIVQLTENIIELIRVDIAHKSDEYSKISLTDIAAETADKFGELMRQKSIIHTPDFSRIPIIMYGVRRDIRELFDILYDNSVRYSPVKSTVNLSISDENSQITIILTNSSKHLTESMLKSIFEPFKRFAPEKISGNGLGLAIARRIVQNHEGIIGAESSEDLFSIKIVFRKNTL